MMSGFQDTHIATPAQPELPPLREVIARHGLSARKSLGQHFLLDRNVTDRIARAAAPLHGHHVIEVGPGPGGLTRALLAAGASQVIAIERDSRCVEALGELSEAYPAQLRVVSDDALKLDAAALCPPPRKIVANLPYNISTALLLRWLAQADAFAGLTLMFQKEVAYRLSAAPKSPAYGRLSVIVQWRFKVERLFNLPARAFTPPPKVDSTVVRLAPRQVPLFDATMEHLEQVTRAAFGQRRKMLRTSLKRLPVDASTLLSWADIPATARAEDLHIEQFCAIARVLRTLVKD